MLAEQQLAALADLLRQGSAEASDALTRWLGRPASIAIAQVSQLPLAAATDVLGDPESQICACSMSLAGPLSGQLLLTFADASGLALADLLTGRPPGSSTQWQELQQSAALETANIIGCAYLNALARGLPGATTDDSALLPSPPRFSRDFAEAILQFALMNQAMASDLVFLTRTEFHIDQSPVDCDLLFIPDAHCLSTLRELLPK